MENNYSTLNTAPVPNNNGVALLVMDIRNFIDIIKLQPAMQSRPIDEKYNRQDNLDYLLAISG